MKNKIKLIFDLDGTVVDSQIRYHSLVESKLLRTYEHVVISKEELAKRFAGAATRKVFLDMAPDCDVEFLFQKKWEMIYELVQSKGIQCLPHMYELIVDLHKNGNEMTVASAAQPKWVELCLRHAIPYGKTTDVGLSLIDIFDGKYFSAGSCTKNKPNPDIFLMAEANFKNIFGLTYVIGDGEGDVIGGLAANLPVLYLSNSDTKFDSNPAVKRFNNSEELSKYIRMRCL